MRNCVRNNRQTAKEKSGFPAIRKPAAFALLVLLGSCVHKGAESKYIKFRGLNLVEDGNNNDSAFFDVAFANNSDVVMKEPFLRMVIKDTSDKFFKPILFSDSQSFEDVPAHTDFHVRFYAQNFHYSDAVGKTKLYLSWTNSKGKRSIRRKVEY